MPDVYLYFNDNRISYGKFDKIKPFDSDIYKLAKAIKYVETIALHFKIHDKLEISINELVNRINVMKSYCNILKNENYKAKIAFKSQDNDTKVIENMCCPFNMQFPLGGYDILVGLVLIGTAKLTGKASKEGVEYELIADLAKKHYEYSFIKGEMPNDLPEKTINNLIKKYENDYTVLVNDSNNLMYGR